MTAPQTQPTFGLKATYFILSLLAPFPMGWDLAEARIRAANARPYHVENPSVFDIAGEALIWAALLMLAIWIAYFFMRRNDLLLRLITLSLTIPLIALGLRVIAFLR